MVECPRCGGEMREGEAFVRVTTSGGQASSGFGMMGIPGMDVPSVETVREKKILWREKTGRKKGWLTEREHGLREAREKLDKAIEAILHISR